MVIFILQVLIGFALVFMSFPHLLRLIVRRQMRPEQFGSALRMARWLYALPILSPAQRAEAAYLVGRAYQRLELHDQAAPYIEEAYTYYKNCAQKPSRLNYVLLARAVQLLEEERYEEIIVLQEYAKSLQLQDIGLKTILKQITAEAYFRLDKHAETQALLDDLLSIEEGLLRLLFGPAWYFFKVRLLMLQSYCYYFDYELDLSHQSASQARDLLRGRRPRPEAEMREADAQMLRCLASKRRFDVAAVHVMDLRKVAVKLDQKTRGLGYRAIALYLLLLEQYDEARAYAERSIHLESRKNEYAESLLIQAGAFAGLGNFARAISLCHQIIDLQAFQFYREHAEALLRCIAKAEMEGEILPISPDEWWFPEYSFEKKRPFASFHELGDVLQSEQSDVRSFLETARKMADDDEDED